MYRLAKIWILLWALLLPTIICAQEARSVVTITQGGDFMEIDPLGNIYIVKGNTITKVNQKSEVMAQYSHRSRGNISSITVVNPMKVFVFYQEAGAIVFLDDKLALLGSPINLFALNYHNISLASYSSQNQIRLLDPFSNEIIMLDIYANELSRNNFTFSLRTAKKIIELGQNQFAIQDSEQGVFLFDNFGTFSKSIALITTKPLFSIPQSFYYFEESKIIGYNYQTLNHFEELVEGTNVQSALLYQEKTIVMPKAHP